MLQPRRYSSAAYAAAIIGAVMLVPVTAAGAATRPGAATWAAGAASVAARASRKATAAGDTWPMFGHDPLHSGVSPDTAIRASTAAGLTVKWSKSLGTGPDQPSPAVAYNTRRNKALVYDVSHAGLVSAFNAATGARIWRRTVADATYSSPAVFRNTVYFGDNAGVLVALNAATGAVQCTFRLPVIAPATVPGRIFSSPVVGVVDRTGPVVFFGDAGRDEAYNGGHLWAVTGVGNTAGKCREKWMYNGWPDKGTTGVSTGVWDQPALARQGNGTWAVVFGSSNPDGAVYALNAATGRPLWRFQTQQTGSDQDVGAGPTISPPGANGFAAGVVYIDGKDGIEYALNLSTGKQIWSFTLGPGSSSALAVSEAALTGGTLVVCYAGSVFALNARTGTEEWEATPGGTIVASPTISGGPGDQVLFVGDYNDYEYGLSLATGAQVFAAATPGVIEDSAAIANGTLYLASGGALYAYAPAG